MVSAEVEDLLIYLDGLIFQMEGPQLKVAQGLLLGSLLGYPPV